MTAIAIREHGTAVSRDMTSDQVELIKRTIAVGATNDELALFIQQCNRTGLDPFARQIYAIKRQGKMTVQVSIDGFRLIAERTGKYAGQTAPQWCGPDGVWVDVWLANTAPAAARVGVMRHDFQQPTYGIATFREYSQQASPMWVKMPATMLAKCFTPDTEVLTDEGFQRFDAVNGKILQVTQDGLEPTDARPFRQEYAGEMVSSHGDMLNFSVTPNHDMITLEGRIEAGAMYAGLRTRPKFRIPLTHVGNRADLPVSDAALRLAGYVVADGTYNRHRKFLVSVSRQHKTDALLSLVPDGYRTRAAAGDTALLGERVITTKADKHVFSFDVARVEGLVDETKQIRLDTLLKLSARQARLFLDAWIEFDGSTNKRTGLRRLYSSRLDHVRAAEVLAVAAGYTVNVARVRQSDGANKNYVLTVSDTDSVSVRLPSGHCPGVVIEPNASGEVWCATVPSGTIVVRRHGFSMLCGNCAEALALRKAFAGTVGALHGRRDGAGERAGRVREG